MKTITKILAAFIALLLVVIACNRTEDSEFNTNSGLDGASDRVVSSKSFNENPGNPYNFVGQIHNEILVQYLDKYQNEGTKDMDVVVERVNEIASSNELLIKHLNGHVPKADTGFLMDGYRDFDNRFKNVIANTKVSREAQRQLSQLVNYMIDKAEGEAEPSYEEVDAYLAKFERNLIKGSERYSKEDQEVLFSAVSTARHSSNLWYNHYMVKSAGEGEDNGKRKWWQWLLVGASDVVGGFAGGGALSIPGATGASALAYEYTDPDKK